MFHFKLPSAEDLTAKQKLAITGKESVTITGAAGSGKSVVLIWRHILNYSKERTKSVLLTYTKSLHYYLKDSIVFYAKMEEAEDESKAKNIKEASKNIELANSWNGNRYDEILIDEAQDLPEYCILTKIEQKKNSWGNWRNTVNQPQPQLTEKLDWEIDDKKSILKRELKETILNNWFNTGKDERVQYYVNNSVRYIIRFSEKTSYCADNTQILYPDKACSEEKLNEIINNYKRIRLYENFRNTFAILNFVKYVLPFNIPHSILDKLKKYKTGTEPILNLVKDKEPLIEKEKQKKVLLRIIEQYNDGATSIAVLAPHTEEVRSIEYYLQEVNKSKLEEEKINFSKYTNEEKDFIGIDFVHLTTYKSAKGLEFDVVVMPFFDNFFRIGEEKILTNEDFYVAFTRAKKNLFLIGTKDLPNIPENILKRQIIK